MPRERNPIPPINPESQPKEKLELCVHGNFKPCPVCQEDERREREGLLSLRPEPPKKKPTIPFADYFWRRE